MSDWLLELSDNPTARGMIETLGLPIPMPEPLDRAEGSWRDRPLAGEWFACLSSAGGTGFEPAVRNLLNAGADLALDQEASSLDELEDYAGTRGRSTMRFDIDELPVGRSFDGFVVDATGFESVSELDRLYDFFRPLLRSLNRCGRIVVIGRQLSDDLSAPTGAAQQALEGFTRSLAKELGRYGSTAQLLRVTPGGEQHLAGPLRFFLTDRSAFVSAQVVTVGDEADEHPEQPSWRRPLGNKVALVTGAARGIGRATARRLADEGATVVAVDLPGTDALDEVVREIDGEALPLDLADDAAPETVADALEVHNGVDIVVHNAGITRDRTLANMKRAAWHESLSVNADAPIRVTEHLLDEELIRDHGRILCMSSIAGIAGNVGQTNYAAGKAGLIGFVRRLADDVADRGVTVNALAPGFIETRLTEEMPVAVREIARRMNALSQGGLPDDVAQAVTFLATPGAQGITGNVLRVCGGGLVGA